MKFLTFDQVAEYFRGKSVAVVGSAPSVLDNIAGVVDSHDVVVRVNNYRLRPQTGYRTDCFYSFFGTSIKKTAEELQRDGVKLCMCKLPNSKPLVSEWHERMRKPEGVDYRYIYRNRKDWWFCDTFIPDDARFLRKFELLDKHQPTTGFAAILDVLECEPSSCYITGFDFFQSGRHNVDELWRAGDPSDPIRHLPELELAWLMKNACAYPLTFDFRLAKIMRNRRETVAA